MKDFGVILSEIHQRGDKGGLRTEQFDGGGPGLGLGFDGWRGGPGRLQNLTVPI